MIIAQLQSFQLTLYKWSAKLKLNTKHKIVVIHSINLWLDWLDKLLKEYFHKIFDCSVVQQQQRPHAAS